MSQVQTRPPLLIVRPYGKKMKVTIVHMVPGGFQISLHINGAKSNLGLPAFRLNSSGPDLTVRLRN